MYVTYIQFFAVYTTLNNLVKAKTKNYNIHMEMQPWSVLKKRLRSSDAFLIDLDGTMYIGARLISCVIELVTFLQKQNKRYMFLTNNSSTSGSAYQKRLESLGIKTSRDQILTSGDATIHHILHKTKFHSVYLVGTHESEIDFLSAGFDLHASDPDCVVVEFVTTFTYSKLKKSCKLLLDGNRILLRILTARASPHMDSYLILQQLFSQFIQ